MNSLQNNPLEYEPLETLCPGALVEHANVDTAAEIADLLVELLSEDDVPEAMREDTRSRLADLYHRFPTAFDDEFSA
jgi:hypothetical protein